MAVNLNKGQRVSLEKPGGGTLSRVRMGLGWDAIEKKGFFGKKTQQDIDLDASCLLFGSGQLIDQVWFNQLRSNDGSIQHTGDNRTGAGDGDDESIIVDLSQVSSNVDTLVFIVNSFTGQDFSQIQNALCRLVDESTNTELARYSLSAGGSYTAQVMAKVSREGSGWSMTAIGQEASGRTFRDLLPAISSHL